ncbi:MAG: tRNA (5-methylaminomethyl-2-thiouridine)(34)-methyltransferase MnmD [Balneolaceae bacterium]|nr:tRNA (5-methylaminomethyl-2-thiouridine)(34)-methyltransferase MnmD [Balneolaceae bacterium]
MSSKPSITTTKDGSHTLYSHRFKQHYHNPNGAVAESVHNFFETNRLIEALSKEKQINILEVGFGTGLNLLLLLDYYQKLNSTASIQFHSVEAYPISGDHAAKFNFEAHIDHPELKQKLVSIFDNLSKGDNEFQVHENITAHIFYGLFEDYNPDVIQADYIFHDAFSPDVNAELWSGETFKKLKSLSSDNVILTTYSAASKAKGAMAWAGWKVARTKGALGKREMTVAALSDERLKEYELINYEHLAKRYEEEDF